MPRVTLRCWSAEQADQQAQSNLVQAEANRYLDTVALFQALGGGWWQRTDLERSPAMRTGDFLPGAVGCDGKCNRLHLLVAAMTAAATLAALVGCTAKSANSPDQSTTTAL